MEKSLWQKDNYDKRLKKIENDLKTDILIIGGGITGISLAYNLKDANYNVTLIDRGKLFNEASAKSTGKINILQDLKYQDIENIYNFNSAKLYYESQKEAKDIILKNIKDNNIKCNLLKTATNTFTYDEKEKNKFNKERKILDKLEIKYNNDLSIIGDKKIVDVISVKDSYVFNPVKYLNGLYEQIKNKINIYENSVATKINYKDNNYITYVNNKKIESKILVIACNYPFFTIPFIAPLKTYEEKSYISAYNVDEIKDIDGISTGSNVISFRYDTDKKNKYFIYLNNSSKLSDKLNYEKNYEENKIEAEKIISKDLKYKWTNMDVMTNDYIPYIGMIKENMYIATGYNTWGNTNGTIAAKVIHNLIINEKSKYEELFSLKRSINIKKIKNFFVNTLYTNLKAYTFVLIKKNPSWYDNKVYVTNINGKRVGVYIDDNNKKHIVSNICPHLKCFLTFNKVDKTWDCPCHGSRFDIEGNVIKGPSSYNIKIDESI